MGNIELFTYYFKGGWACCKKCGAKYGRKCVGPFKKDIEDMFLLGQNDISKRLGPGRMLDRLKKKYPDKFDLPSETEIRQAMSTLASQLKKGVQPSLQHKRGINETFLSTVMIVEGCAALTPEEAWNMFVEHHPDAEAENYPTKK